MFNSVKIAPSILSADFMNLARDIAMIEEGGADLVHVDVMDGHFVPNLSMGVPIVKQLKRTTSLPLDVHLMIDNPLDELPWFLDAGADIVTMHAEAFSTVDDMARAIELAHEANVLASMSVKPRTPVYAIADVIADLDMVLIMSVEPGFSGQSFIAASEDKVARVVELAGASASAPLVEVDGGIGIATAPRVASSGADVLVCGNAVFKADDPARAIVDIRAAAEAARLAHLDDRTAGVAGIVEA